jgi:hypothetical protein
MLLFQNKTAPTDIVEPAFLLLNFLVLNVSIITDFAISFSFIFVKNIYKYTIKILSQSFIINMLAQQP